MLTVEKAKREMFEDIYELLQDFNIPNSTKGNWVKIFNYDWNKEEDYCGYVLVDKGKVVGFIGAIFSKRLINGKIEKFCNLSSWIVKEDYRKNSMSLIYPILKLRDYTITNFTASATVYLILKQLGFKELDKSVKILFLFPYLGKLVTKSNFSITTDKNSIRKQLLGNDSTIFNDHVPYNCGHFLLSNTDRYCYMVYTRVKKKGISFNYIHYISHQDVFQSNINQIKLKLFKENKSILTMIDSRFLDRENILCSFDYKSIIPRLYKSSTLSEGQIDNLYSELILLSI